jgi:large subunit ribosomal protein L4
MKLNVFGNTGKNTELEVSNEVFGQKPVASLLAQAVRVYLSNQRQGTSKVKTRADINRTKKKWYKQKGTGGARHGARTPSIFVGGAVAHGPTGLRLVNETFCIAENSCNDLCIE